MNLPDFLRETQAQVRAQMSEGSPYAEIVFAEIVMQHMADIGMTFEPSECHFPGKIGNRKFRLSGYAMSDDQDQLDLFVCLYEGVDELTPVPDSETKVAVEQCLLFLTMCAEGKMASKLEPSSDVRSLAETLQAIYDELEQVRVFVLTDQVAKSKSFKTRDIAGNREDSAWQIPRKVARQLVLSGWLQTPEPRQEFRKPSKEAVRQMLLRLRACARGAPPTGQRTIALSSPYLYKNIVSLAVGELLSKVISGAVPLYASTPRPDFDGLKLPLEVLPSLWRSRLKQQGEAVSPSLQVELFQC